MRALALPLLLLSATVQAADRDPPPLPVGRVSFIVGLVSRIHDGEPAIGSGFLIGPCHIMTARHVAPPGRDRVGSRLHFNGQAGSNGTVIAVGNDDASRSPGMARGGDWIVARLDRCIGTRIGYFAPAHKKIDRDQVDQRDEVFVAGFPNSRARDLGVLVSKPCRIGGLLVDGTIVTPCPVSVGNSGGPLFKIRVERGQVTYVALGVVDAGDRVYSFSAPVSEIAASVPELTSVMAATE